MMRNRLAIAGLTVIALHSGLVSALGLGELALNSMLNQPFRAEIPLRDIGDLSVDEIKVRLAETTVFENAGVDRGQFLSNLQFKVELIGGGNGRIVITTASSVVEPYLDFIVEARWPNGKMIREYTVLLDLPVFANDKSPQAVVLSSAAPAGRQNSPVQTSALVPGEANGRELGGAIGAVDRAPPTARSPERQQDLPAADNPSEYRIQRNDTMWRIASTLRPSSYVTTQQTMMALVKKNPQAFIGGNVNRIKAGYLLRLPSEAEVREVDHQAAVAEMRVQVKAWRGEKIARTANTKPTLASQSSATPMAPQIDATAKTQTLVPNTSDESGKFSLGSADDIESANEVSVLRDRIREEQENLEKSKLENSAMRNRVIEMENQIQTLKSLIVLKNSQLAALTPPQATVVDVAPITDATPAMPSATQTAKVNATDKPVAPETPFDVLQRWISQNLTLFVGLVFVLLALVAFVVRRRGATLESSALAEVDDDLAAGESVRSPALFEGRRPFDPAADDANTTERVDGDADPVFIDKDFDFDTLHDDSPAQGALSESDSNMLTGDSVFEESDSFAVADANVSAADTVVPQTADVVAEAEIYVAYGRYDQAASLLKAAVIQDPDNVELRLKLIDIYLDTRDQDNFEAVYQGLQALNDDDAIIRVKESMSAIDGVSHWLAEEKFASSTNTVELGNSDTIFDGEATDLNVNDDIKPLSFADEDVDVGSDDAPRGDAEIESSAVGEFASDIDTDTLASLDVDLADLDFEFEDDFGESEANKLESSELDDLDFKNLPSATTDSSDAGLGDGDTGGINTPSDDLSSVSAGFSEEARQIPESTDDEASRKPNDGAGDGESDSDSIELDLSEFDMEFSDTLGTITPVFESAEDLGDLDLELSGFDMPSEVDRAAAPAFDGLEIDEALVLDEVDADDKVAPDNNAELDSELTTGSQELGRETPAPVAEPTNIDGDAISVEDLVFDEFDAVEEDVEGFDSLLDSESVATKLDLARAYIDMGDSEGAREMLEEVLHDGDIQQQSDAQALLDNIG